MLLDIQSIQFFIFPKIIYQNYLYLQFMTQILINNKMAHTRKIRRNTTTQPRLMNLEDIQQGSMASLIRALNSRGSEFGSIIKNEPKTPLSPSKISRKSDIDQHSLLSYIQFQNNTSIQDYIIGKQIGKGSFAKVLIATFIPTGEKVALKIYEKYRLSNTKKRNNLHNEIKVLMKLDHKGIAKLRDTIVTSKEVILVMELVCGQSMSSYLKNKKYLDENEARPIFIQISEALHFCHSSQVCHRDIKLDNIHMHNYNKPKLIDFGFSTCIPNGRKFKIFCGTPKYMAPEIVAKREHFGPPVDIWALGIVLYALLCGNLPFKGQSEGQLFRNIQRAELSFSRYLSDEAQQLLRGMLNQNPDSRYTITEVLTSSWVIGIDNDKE